MQTNDRPITDLMKAVHEGVNVNEKVSQALMKF